LAAPDEESSMTRRPNLANAALLISLVCLVPLAHPRCAAAAPYERRWYTVDGGGAISNRDVASGYRLGATIGQPDAYTMTGGVYRLRGGFWTGRRQVGYLDVVDEPQPLPTRFRALAPSPNPCRGDATIAYELPNARNVVVRLSDVQGRLVRELVNSHEGPGLHRVSWNGRDESGARAPRGMYFVHIEAGGDRSVAKLILLTEGNSR
jgi:hypothetical protein